MPSTNIALRIVMFSVTDDCGLLLVPSLVCRAASLGCSRVESACLTTLLSSLSCSCANSSFWVWR
jgi:hypothetical protein